MGRGQAVAKRIWVLANKLTYWIERGEMTMEKVKNDGAAGLSFHKLQRSAAHAAGTAGYTGHLSRNEIDRRMANYQAIMDLAACGNWNNERGQDHDNQRK
jgi:hypothetical protein